MLQPNRCKISFRKPIEIDYTQVTFDAGKYKKPEWVKEYLQVDYFNRNKITCKCFRDLEKGNLFFSPSQKMYVKTDLVMVNGKERNALRIEDSGWMLFSNETLVCPICNADIEIKKESLK